MSFEILMFAPSWKRNPSVLLIFVISVGTTQIGAILKAWKKKFSWWGFDLSKCMIWPWNWQIMYQGVSLISLQIVVVIFHYKISLKLKIISWLSSVVIKTTWNRVNFLIICISLKVDISQILMIAAHSCLSDSIDFF